MMCKALLIRSLDRAQSLATCFCSGSCPTGISVSTCSGNSYTVHSFGLFCKTDSIWSLVNLCTNHCQVPLAMFLECKESFPSLPLFLAPLPPSPWYIINPSTQITLLDVIAFLTFFYKQWAPKSQGCDSRVPQGTPRYNTLSLVFPGACSEAVSLLCCSCSPWHTCVWHPESTAKAMAAFWLLDKYKILIFTQNAALDYLDPVLHLYSPTLSQVHKCRSCSALRNKRSFINIMEKTIHRDFHVTEESFNCFRIFLVIPITVIRKQFHVQNHKGALRVLSWFSQGFSVWACSWAQRGFPEMFPVCSTKHMCTSEWAENITQCLSHMSSSTQAHKTHKHTYSVSNEYLCNCSDLRCATSAEQFLTGIIMGTVPFQRMFVFIRVCLITSEMKLMNRCSGRHHMREIWKIILAYSLAGKGILEWKKSLINMVKEI